MHLQVVLDCNGVLVLEQVADFFEPLECLIGAVLDDMADYLSDMLVQVADVFLRLGFE